MRNVSNPRRSILLAAAFVGGFMFLANNRPSHAADAPAPVTQPADETPHQPIHNTLAERIKDLLEGPAQLKQLENKPLVVSGRTVDGKEFSSAEYKGKVVLVDFWATWCGPCCEETPRIKELYSKYHDKGLEVLGVSNDIDVDALTKYLAKNQMPWPQLFNAESAAERKPNPITVGYGITGIPTMFLIDRAGVLRTTDARELMEKMIPELLDESAAPASSVQTPASQPSAAEHASAGPKSPATSEEGNIPLTAAIRMMRALGKPLVIAGKQPNGKAFSTADWMGKVILVDFWGTWCGPCLEELPRVKKMYSQYHSQGLEVIGVDNDASAEALTNFLAADPRMPWPQLFDADAAKVLKFNSIAMGLGVESIPVMFVVDKKGVLRSVTGRKDMEKVIPELLAE